MGLIFTPQHADSLIAEGKADMVMIARAALDDPRWGLHATVSLGEIPDYPAQYAWASPKGWRGYELLHG